MQIDHEAHIFPTKVRERNTIGWMDAGHDGLIDVYSQRQPEFRNQKKFDFEFVNCWKRNGGENNNNNNSQKKIWETGKLYITQVHSCHLAPVFHCPKTWKVIWKMVYVIHKNHQQQKKTLSISTAAKTPSSRPSNKSSVASSEGASSKKPDQQQPHMHFRYHYHHNYYHHQHYKNVFSHISRCVTSNIYNLSIFGAFLLLFFGYYLFSSSSSSTYYQLLETARTSLFFLVSHSSLILVNIVLFYLSETDIDYIEKMMISFNFSRLLLVSSFLFASASKTVAVPYRWLCLNQFLEILGVYCLSHSYDGGHNYQYSHNKKLNNIYNYLCFPKLIMHLFAYSFLSGLDYNRPHTEKTEFVSVLFMKIYFCYTLITRLPPVLWQLTYHFRHHFGVQQTAKKSRNNEDLEEHKPSTMSHYLPLSFTQLSLCYTGIFSHIFHHCLWGILFYHVMELLYLQFFAAGVERTFFSCWQVLGFAICTHLVIVYNYVNLSNNLQFTLIKLQFWPRHLAKHFLSNEIESDTMSFTKNEAKGPAAARQKMN